MNKMFAVYCIYKSGKELESAIILLCSDLVEAVDTAKKADQLGYDFNHPQTLYVTVAEVKPGCVYKRQDFQPLSRSENFPVIFVRFYDVYGETAVKNEWFNR